ncbi:ATP-binding protein [Pararobbsia alpina]|uniref:ATP-binding protein n=1 Tax=Pararobbsia alpina TaxID=621374 RepID=UPI0039A53666
MVQIEENAWRHIVRYGALSRAHYLVLSWVFGFVSLSFITWVTWKLGLSHASAGFVFLIALVLLSLMDSYLASGIFSLFAAAALNYFFVPPLYSFEIADLKDCWALLAFLTTSLIITSLIRHTRRLGDAHREQAKLIDLTHDSMFVRGIDDVITFWNRGAEALYGWNRDAAVGKVSHRLLKTRFPVPPEDITQTLDKDGFWEGELLHIKQDGEEVAVASRWSLLRDARGQKLATLETNNDITKRKLAEDTLRRTQAAYLAEAQKLSGTGSFGWNPNKKTLFWSEQTFDILDYDLSVQPSIELMLARVHPDDTRRFRDVVIGDGQLRDNVDLRYRLMMTDRSIKYVHLVARTISELAPEVEYVGALMDVTASERTQQALHEAHAELAHVSRLTTMGELSASIAHEVGQPLSGIVTDADACLRWLMRDTPSIDEARACLARILADGKRAGEIVQRIRQLTRRAEPQKIELDVNETIRESASLVHREIRNQGVVVQYDLATGLEPTFADKIQLQQVLINLILNGIQAMVATVGHTKELHFVSRSDGNGQINVTVRDSGKGIDPSETDRLFKAFFTTRDQGMGMGLSICRSIIEAHGGSMTAENNTGPGASFGFSLPVLRKTASAASA